jgi:hypothetical protein
MTGMVELRDILEIREADGNDDGNQYALRVVLFVTAGVIVVVAIAAIAVRRGRTT